jgi:DNA mismatch endonuclease (patch repair protein)
MPDCFDPAKRSEIMSRIRAENTAPEAALHALLRRWLPSDEWEPHPRDIAGRPDAYLRFQRIAIFVDGCFFHGCPQHFRPPETNADYWLPKIKRNRKRDREVNRTLRGQGIRVIRVWEHDLKGKKPKGRERIRRRLRYAQARQPVILMAAEPRAAYNASPPSKENLGSRPGP